jgi:hypothetical protein
MQRLPAHSPRIWPLAIVIPVALAAASAWIGGPRAVRAAQGISLEERVERLESELLALKKTWEQKRAADLASALGSDLRHARFAIGLATGRPDQVPEDQRNRTFVPAEYTDIRLGAVDLKGGTAVAVWLETPHHVMEQVRYSHLIPEVRKGNEVWLKARAVDGTVSISTHFIHVLYRQGPELPYEPPKDEAGK